MANLYTQDIELNADGASIAGAFKQVEAFIADIQRQVAGVGATAEKGAKEWATQLAQNLKMLKQAQADLRTLQTGNARPGEFANADRAANKQNLIEAKVFYREKQNLAREEANAEKALAKEVLDYEKAQDRAAIASAKEVAAARREAATAAVTAKARGITNRDDALAAKSASDQRLTQLRREREAVASNDVAGARGIADRIALEKALGRELDGTIRRLNQQVEAERRAKDAADRRLAGQLPAVGRLLAPANVRDEINRSGDARTSLVGYKFEQELARRNMQAQLADRNVTLEQVTAARQRLELANANVAAAEKLVREDEKALGIEQRRNALTSTEQRRAQTMLSPGNVRDEYIRSGNSRSTLIGYQFEQETARRALQAQVADRTATADQIAAARQRLELANANVRAAEQLVREDQKALEIEQRINQTGRLEQQKAQVALAAQYAREQIAAVGPKEAMRRAAEATALAEQRLTTASAEHLAVARQEVELARARQNATEKQGRNPLTSILSPGYAVSAFARTSVYGAAAGAAYGAFGAVRGGFDEVIQMEDELAKLQAIANATEGQMQTLRASIYSVGDSSRYSVIDLAKISQTLAQAGVSAGEMESVLRSVTTLATASGSTPDEAVNLVTAALGSFQLQASESARIADLMTSALNRTKLTVQQTGQAIQYVGATAFEQNISLEQLLATVGAIAQAGVRSGSTIGTGFRQFLVDLQTPSEKLATQLKAVGLSASDVNVAVRGLPAVLNSLRDAGFGSAQAYEGLETRAAAFYLVAKNNVGTMEQLQIAFAQQGAAALANERAMNSLTAQWQRFKNIISEDFADSLDVPLTLLQDLLTRVSDHLTEMDDAAKKLERAQAGGLGGYQKEYGAVSGTVQYSLNSAGDRVMSEAVEDIKNILNGFGLTNLVGVEGLGDQWVAYTQKIAGARSATDEFDTALAKASEKVDAQAGKISELDKEMVRLLTQQDSLKGNTLGVSAETASLTARFDGLAKYLTNAKDGYSDLIGAMQRYRQEASQTQVAYLNAQRSLMGQQANTAKVNATNLANQALNTPSLMAQLTEREREALRQPRMGANGTVIADAGARLNNDTLRRLSIELGTLATSTAEARIATTQLNNTVAENTRAGQSLLQRTQASEAQLTKFTSLTQPEQVAAAPALRAQAQGVKTEAQNRLNNPNTVQAARPTLESILTRADAILKGVTAALAPTKAETAEAKRAEREAKKAEREADRAAKLVTQADVDRVGLGLGLKLSSGTRTPAEQEALFRAGKTPARGIGPRVSNHVNSVARDFSVAGLSDVEAERYAATMRAQYRAAGITARVEYETGKGKNQGTGRHIHVGVAKGTTRRADRSEEVEDKYDVQLDRSQISLDEDDLKTKLKELGKATSQETFDAAVSSAKLALDKVNAQLKDAALNELAATGIAPGSPQFKARLAQVTQTINQNVEEFNDKVTDAIIKSVNAQTKAADTAFQAAVQPANNRLQFAQSQLSGLDNYSLRNRVPEYVKNLASNRVAMAQENAAKAEYIALPGRINEQQSAMDALRGTIGRVGVNPDQVNAQLATMNVELEKLIANREALGAALGAGGLLPETIGQGLNQAMQAYQQANTGPSDVKSIFLSRVGDDITHWADTVKTGVGQVMQDIIDHPMESLKVAGDWFSEFFSSVGQGSMNVLRLFGSMAQGIIGYMGQIAAKAVATQLLGMLMNFAGSVIGGGMGMKVPGGSSGAVGTAGTIQVGNKGIVPLVGQFHGGPAGEPIHRMAGGAVQNGSTAADSVDARLARGEWVVQKNAVDSVGNKFMAQLNQHGSKALDGLRGVPALDMQTHLESNIYVVPPNQQPQMGPNDVKVLLTDELMNGDSKRLVEHIARSSR